MTSSSSSFAVYRRVLRETRQYWKHLVVIGGLNLLATPLALLAPWPVKIAIDCIADSKPLPAFLAWLPDSLRESRPSLLVFAVAMLVCVEGVRYLNGMAMWITQCYAGERMVLDFRTRLFRHVQRLSFTYHDSKGTSDSVYRIQYDAPALRWIAIDGVIPFASSTVLLLGMLTTITLIDWPMAVAALTVAPVLLLLTRLSGRRLRSEWDELRNVESAAMSVVQETLGALRVVKAFGQEERERIRFIDKATRGMKGQLRVAATIGLFDLLTGLTIASGTAAVLYIGIRHVLEGRITVGDLWVVLAYLAWLFGPLQQMSKKITDLQGSIAGAARAFALLDEAGDVREAPDAQPMSRARGEVRFENTSFSYNDGQPVLANVNLTIPAGSRVGIVGRTGAGKTTLMSLLLRFFDPTGGSVSLDGIDLRKIKLADLRGQYSIVLQEPLLFSTSIAENIAYALPDATRERIVAAAKAAQAHEFIVKNEEGYDAQVGERGMKLSGGERQRISIARAFLKNAPILILDEPTSSVDLATESAIMGALEELMQNRTTFIIAHRLNTLARCDIILRVEDGAVGLDTDMKRRIANVTAASTR